MSSDKSRGVAIVITIEKKTTKNIPFLVVEDKDIVKSSAPVMVFYHGWTNAKESLMTQAYVFALDGYAVFVPDALLHGERKQENRALEGTTDFYRILFQNVKELPTLREYMEENGYDGTDITVGGISMGGFTTSMLLTTYDWVTAGASFIGCPDPVSFGKDMLVWQYENGGKEKYPKEIWDDYFDQMDRLASDLRHYSLAENLNKILEKPYFIFHGGKDEVVPVKYDRLLAEDLKKSHGKHFRYSEQPSGGHHVPYRSLLEAIDFLNNERNQ